MQAENNHKIIYLSEMVKQVDTKYETFEMKDPLTAKQH